jgi:hypothetical protein
MIKHYTQKDLQYKLYKEFGINTNHFEPKELLQVIANLLDRIEDLEDKLKTPNQQ